MLLKIISTRQSCALLVFMTVLHLSQAFVTEGERNILVNPVCLVATMLTGYIARLHADSLLCVNWMAAGSRLQVQSWIFSSFKHTLCN